MNRNSSGLNALEDVLDALVASAGTPSASSPEQWIRDYPQFERELVDFIASWTIMNSASPKEPSGPEADALVLRGMSIVQNLLHEMSSPPDRGPAIDSLLGRAQSLGMSLKQFAGAVRLGQVLMRKLDRRLIRYPSIPKDLLARLSATLECQEDDVSLYLQQAPTLATSARYRADSTPTLADPQDFDTAVRSDPTMAEEDRSHWLRSGAGNGH